ncbi:MAG: hypothetical protein HN576_02305 [Bacteriovoracaceae bacterium]|jgi:hypothetical protein|nr:hypothetical protein [Bacteriovoracaceae bacterium]
MLFRLSLILFVILGPVYGAETCSRVAIINFQEILVDTNSTQMGEGLRYHLEKDSTAIKYLDAYQEGNKINLQNAILGTAGSGLILAGLMGGTSSETKQTLFISGVSMIIVNFLVANTLEMTNEVNLLKAVEEYNKRNLPRIYFKSYENDSRAPGSVGHSFYLEKIWRF